MRTYFTVNWYQKMYHLASRYALIVACLLLLSGVILIAQYAFYESIEPDYYLTHYNDLKLNQLHAKIK